MLQTRCWALSAVKRLRFRPQRRYESSHSSGQGEHAHHAAPKEEHFGRGFYIALATIPVCAALYKFSHNDPDSPPLFTRIINSYTAYTEQWTVRNTLHTRMIEQAAFDRNLFQTTMARGSASGQGHMVELRFPEVFNTGSPYGVPTSHAVNLDGLIAHYKKKNAEMAEKVANKTPQQRLASSSEMFYDHNPK